MLLISYIYVSLQGNRGGTAPKLFQKHPELLVWIYHIVQLFQIYCHMLAFCVTPPVPHIVSSLRCAEWLHESVNVINVTHYWQDCFVSLCSWFHCRNASGKTGLLTYLFW